MDKILTALLTFRKHFNTLTSTSRFVIIGGIVVIAAFMMGKCNGDDKLEQFNLRYAEFKNNSEKTSLYADSLNSLVVKLVDENAKKDDVVKKLKNNIVARANKQDALKSTLLQLEKQANLVTNTITDTSLVVVYKDSIIGNLKGQVVIAESIITDQHVVIVQRDSQTVLLQRAVTVSSTRADSLQHILRTLPPPAPNPNKLFGFIPKPSRTVVGVTALVLGVVVGAELKR
jgi:ABC-type transporter Mla subunit MlaD